VSRRDVARVGEVMVRVGGMTMRIGHIMVRLEG
jgi:hypothetical protein